MSINKEIMAMNEQESFNQIDLAIESFKENEGSKKSIKVSKTPNTDWLDFNWRQLTWSEHNIEFLIEIYPAFDDHKKITGWNLYSAAWYDQDKKRYYLSKSFAENEALEFITNNSGLLISKCYSYLAEIAKEQIPFAVHLK